MSRFWRTIYIYINNHINNFLDIFSQKVLRLRLHLTLMLSKRLCLRRCSRNLIYLIIDWFPVRNLFSLSPLFSYRTNPTLRLFLSPRTSSVPCRPTAGSRCMPRVHTQGTAVYTTGTCFIHGPPLLIKQGTSLEIGHPSLWWLIFI